MNMIFYILGSTTASHSNSNTVDSNGYRSDSSLLNGGRGGESSVYNNGGAIQNFANSQVEGKMWSLGQIGQFHFSIWLIAVTFSSMYVGNC